MANYNKTHWVNNVTVVDAQKLNNLENEVFLLNQSGETNSIRLEKVEDDLDNKLDSVSTEESSEGTVVKFYANKNLKEQITVKGGSSVHVSPNKPASLEAVWIDTDDEDIDANLKESEILTEFQNKFKTMQKSIDDIDYALKYKIDSGYFKDIEPGTNPEDNVPEPGTPEGLKPRPEGTVNAIAIKRGYKKDLEPLMEGEFGFCLDTEELYIGNKGMPRLIARVGGTGGSSGGGNLTGKFLELESDLGKKYRIHVDEDGYLHTWESIVDTAVAPSVDESSKFDGLVIRAAYGGGAKDTNKTVCSHGFIELYNNTKYVFNLKGLSLQYASNNEDWKCLPLRGIIKPYCSFLVRCAQHTDINKPNLRYKIQRYDMHWDIPLSDKSMKIYLCIGTTPCKYPNPFDINNGGGMKAPGYINMFSVGGITIAPNGAISNDFPIDAYEKSFRYVIDKNTMAYRIDAREWKDATTGRSNKNYCFADTGNNYLDIFGLDLREADPKVYMPRCSMDGVWNTYYNKLPIDPIAPTCINIGYGEDAHTSRTFNWQTLPYEKGFVKYRKKGTYEWSIEKASHKTIAHPETNATVHAAIVHGLSNGFYEYQVGAEGRWSDIAEFEVKSPSDSDTIQFIQVGDQQGWIEKEYTVWGIVLDEINKKHQYDFMINVGDISQNGGARSYEWRYYYDQAPILKNKCHMTTCGNNDLTYDEVVDKKIDPIAFTWYSCVENAPFISCYSWNYGYIHFICINSNVLNPEIATEQIEWLKKDMAKEENKKRWTIVYMHEAPYTHTRSERLVPFINPFAELGVDLVLCGHHHRYTRSKRMGALGPNKENRESPTGFYCVMGQAAGFKLAGKTKPASNNHEYMEIYDDTKVPCYIVWNVTHDRIQMESYKVHNIVPFETNIGKTPEVEKFDTLTITK